MVQTFGILGFLFSLLALFFASEVLRRSNHRMNELEMALFKATTRIQKIEAKMHHVDRLAAEVRFEKKRQAETISAMANKGELKTSLPPAPEQPAQPVSEQPAQPLHAQPKGTAHERATADRFTPTEFKQKKSG